MEDTLTMHRRQFLGGTAGVGLTLGFSLGGSLAPLASQAAGTPQPVNSWLTVGTDNSISLTVGASDMGQGSLQGLAQVIAEDLMVDFNRVTLVQGQATLATPAPKARKVSSGTVAGKSAAPARKAAAPAKKKAE